MLDGISRRWGAGATMVAALAFSLAMPAHAEIKVYNKSLQQLRIEVKIYRDGTPGGRNQPLDPGGLLETLNADIGASPNRTGQNYKTWDVGLGSKNWMSIKMDCQVGSQWQPCLATLVSVQGSGTIPFIGKNNVRAGNNTAAGCKDCAPIDARGSQMDVEIEVDRDRKTWLTAGNDISWICKGMTPEQRAAAPYCPK